MTPEQHETAKRMWAEGASGKRIAYELGTTRKRLFDYTHYHRSEFPARHHGGRLTEAQRAEIRRMRAEGATYARIAKAMGVHINTVYNTMRRQT